MALANLRLREALQQQAVRDSLTGLFNRRYLEETLPREIQRAERRQSSLALILCDVDYFKQINDTHGHEAGDVVLRDLGRLLQSQVRGADVACRLGGEEFVILMADISPETAATRAEAIRAGFSALGFNLREKTIGPITLSLGVALAPQHGADGDSVLNAADKALYQSKRNGRNQVNLAESDPPPGHPEPPSVGNST